MREREQDKKWETETVRDGRLWNSWYGEQKWIRQRQKGGHKEKDQRHTSIDSDRHSLLLAHRVKVRPEPLSSVPLRLQYSLLIRHPTVSAGGNSRNLAQGHKLHIVTQDVRIMTIKSTRHHMLITDITDATDICGMLAALEK